MSQGGGNALVIRGSSQHRTYPTGRELCESHKKEASERLQCSGVKRGMITCLGNERSPHEVLALNLGAEEG